MPFKSTWRLEVGCNSQHQAEEVFQFVAKALELSPTIGASYWSFASINPLTYKIYPPGFEVRFELSHDANDQDVCVAVADVLRLAQRLSRHWEIFFARDGLVDGKTNHVRNAGRTVAVKWRLSSGGPSQIWL